MFKKLLKNKKAQQTAEYALLISLVVAAVIAMQTYAQRTIQARIKDASQYLTAQTSALGSTNQYEPYYASSSYTVSRADATTEILGRNTAGTGGLTRMDTLSNRTREKGGRQDTKYTEYGLINGI
ncbi:MAG: hypothetical protein NUV91_04860 [Candidatus Omnitrophica bacterium]|nr:hypothetical protein [Candidatus Omnitrophota bacterium]